MCEEAGDYLFILPLTQHTELSTAGKTADTQLAHFEQKTIANMPDWSISAAESNTDEPGGPRVSS